METKLETSQVSAAEQQLVTAMISCSSIITGYNPRKYFDPAAMAELESSVRENGVYTPILVRRLSEDSFALCAGERRLRATMKVHGDDAPIPARIIEADDAQAAAIAIIENMQRQQMGPAEESEAAAKLLGELGGDRNEVARRLGMSRQTLDKRLALMNATDTVRAALTERKIQLGHAELLAGLVKAKQDETLSKLLAMEKLPTVEQCRALLENAARQMSAAIFEKTDCASCPHNSDLQASMFADSISAGHCTNGSCYDSKTNAALNAKVEALKDEYPLIRIVVPGDNYTCSRLVVDGPKGVGTEQGNACRACEKFGAAVMGTPDALGKVVKDACFDPNCQAKMVAKRMKDEAKAAASAKAPAEASQGAAAKGTTSKGAAASTTDKKPAAGAKEAGAKAPVTEVKVTGQAEEYRKALWRDALRAEIRTNVLIASRVLVAGAVCGQASNIGGSKLAETLKTVSGMELGKTTVGTNLSGADMATVLVALGDIDDGRRRMLALEVTAAMVEKMSDYMVVSILKHFEVDLSKHFKLGEDLLKKLTKSEIEVMAKDIGLDVAMGADAFKGMLGRKKDELIAAALKVEGFDYTKVPAFLSLDAKLS